MRVLSRTPVSKRRKSARRDAHYKRRHRRPLIEMLEARQLLAAEFHNSIDPVDVTGDGRRTATDLLQIINHMSRSGPELPQLKEGEQPTSFWDVNADSRVTVGDALIVVSHLEAAESNALDSPAGGLLYLPFQQGNTVLQLSETGFGFIHTNPLSGDKGFRSARTERFAKLNARVLHRADLVLQRSALIYKLLVQRTVVLVGPESDIIHVLLQNRVHNNLGLLLASS